MIKKIKSLMSWLFNTPVNMGVSVSYDNTSVSQKALSKAQALPVSNYSAKYFLQPQSLGNTFELASVDKFGKDKSLYKLRCIQTSETITVDKTAFEMLFEKIKATK